MITKCKGKRGFVLKESIWGACAGEMVKEKVGMEGEESESIWVEFKHEKP